jgi:hypothetical protein
LLTDVRFIYGDEALFEESVRQVSEFRDQEVNRTRSDVLRAFKSELDRVVPKDSLDTDRSPYFKSDLGSIHVKYQYYRWLEQIPRYLCEFYQLEAIGARRQVEALCQAKKMCVELKDQILSALEAVARLRVKIQLEGNADDHRVLRSPPVRRHPRTHKKTYEQNEQTGRWDTVLGTGEGDPYHVLTDRERSDLFMVHFTVVQLFKRSYAFFEWAAANEMQPKVEKVTRLERLKVSLGFRKTPKPSGSPGPFKSPLPMSVAQDEILFRD